MPWSSPSGTIDGLAPVTRVSGRYYPPFHTNTPGTVAAVIDRAYAAPFFVGRAGAVIRGMQVRSGTTGASLLKLGIYSTVAGRPAILLANNNASPLSTPTINTDYAFDFASDLTVGEGMYWSALLANTTNIYNGLATTEMGVSNILGGTTYAVTFGGSGNSTGESYYSAGLYTSGLPADLTGLSALYVGGMPAAIMRER